MSTWNLRPAFKKLPKAEQKDAIQEVMELVKITDVRKRLIRNLGPRVTAQRVVWPRLF